MRLKIYLCGVYKTDRDMIGRKVIFLSYLFNMYASFCGVALLLCNGNIEEIWVEFVLDLLWTKILYKMLKHTIYILLPPWVKFYLQIKSVLKVWWCVNIHQYKEKCWCSLLLLINWWLYEFGNILEIDLISQGYMLSVSINILCEINLYDCCLDGQDRAVSGLASSSDRQGHHLLIWLRTGSWRKTKPPIYCVISSCIMERHTVWYAVIQEKDAWFQRKLPSFDIFILCDVWNILASKHFRGNQFHFAKAYTANSCLLEENWEVDNIGD